MKGTVAMGFWKDRYSKPGPGIPKDAPKKKGIALFFDILIRELFELIKLNLLFIVFCIPIITIPAAITAMTRVTIKMIRDENHYVWNDFWQTFKKEWKPASLGGWLIIAIMLLSIVGVNFYGQIAHNGIFFMLSMIISLMLGVLTLITSFYFFPMIAMVDLPLKLVLKDSLLLTFTCIGSNLLAGVIFCVSVFFLYVYFFFAIPLIILLACALLNLICTQITYTGIEKYVIKKEE